MVLTSTYNLCFEQKYEKKNQIFLSEIFHFLIVKFSIYLIRRVFVMLLKITLNSKFCNYSLKVRIHVIIFCVHTTKPQREKTGTVAQW